MFAIAFTSFYLWRGEDQAPAEKLADAQETVGLANYQEQQLQEFQFFSR